MTPRRLRARLAEERGVTLIELLVTIPVAVVILTAVMVMMNVTFRQTQKVNDRVAAIQKGRAAMDQVTRELRSQVCPVTTRSTFPTTATVDGNSVTFYADLSGGASSPEKRMITYDASSKTLTEYRYVATSGTWPNLVYPGSPTRTRELLNNVDPVGNTPVFSYFPFTTTGTVSSTPLNTPLSTADMQKVVKIGTSFVARPRTAQSPQSTTFQSEVDVRTADPNKPTEPPRCL
jgi:Tfp pilus assembly protein PilW